MSIFAPHNVEAMNEDDVAGELVRPLCRALGYSQGNPEANLRSQVALQYDKAFLGHKNPGKDPVLRGRPDFVCEVVSYTRWVVEAKSPSIELSVDDSYQAHTYSTHPEIAAELYMLTNGREFRLYRVAEPEKVILTWSSDQTDEMLPVLRNILGPEAMKRRANVRIDLGKPLADGIGSAVEIVAGHVVYEKTTATIPLQKSIDGLTNSIHGKSVKRLEDGRISAQVNVRSAFAELEEIHDAIGFSSLTFNTSEEFLSIDRENPTLLQNIVSATVPAGTEFPTTLLSPGGKLAIGFKADCYTEALGFIEGNIFKGTFVIDYDYELIPSPYFRPPIRNFEMRTEGRFEIRFQ
ncbi:type I restriction endonuclease subunit R [Sinorhizobium meliloti]|nr:type I restriction endonuclease subunit R [Sinorhizobium meliloti]